MNVLALLSAVGCSICFPASNRTVVYAVLLEFCNIPSFPMFTPSTASLPALTRLIVVSVACHTSSVPTPRASVVESTTHASGNPVQFVRVQLVGVPSNGVIRVGLVANTRTQVPVSSLTTHASCAEVVEPN